MGGDSMCMADGDERSAARGGAQRAPKRLATPVMLGIDGGLGGGDFGSGVERC